MLPYTYIICNTFHGLGYNYTVKQGRLSGRACVFACCLLSLSPPLLPTGTLHLSRGRGCQTRCHVLSEYSSLKGTWTAFRRPIQGEGIKEIDKDKTENRRFNL